MRVGFLVWRGPINTVIDQQREHNRFYFYGITIGWLGIGVIRAERAA